MASRSLSYREILSEELAHAERGHLVCHLEVAGWNWAGTWVGVHWEYLDENMNSWLDR